MDSPLDSGRPDTPDLSALCYTPFYPYKRPFRGLSSFQYHILRFDLLARGFDPLFFDRFDARPGHSLVLPVDFRPFLFPNSIFPTSCRPVPALKSSPSLGALYLRKETRPDRRVRHPQ